MLEQLKAARTNFLLGKDGSVYNYLTSYIDMEVLPHTIQINKIGRLALDWGFCLVYKIKIEGGEAIYLFHITINSEKMNNGHVYLFNYDELFAFQTEIYDGRF